MSISPTAATRTVPPPGSLVETSRRVDVLSREIYTGGPRSQSTVLRRLPSHGTPPVRRASHAHAAAALSGLVAPADDVAEGAGRGDGQRRGDRRGGPPAGEGRAGHRRPDQRARRDQQGRYPPRTAAGHPGGEPGVLRPDAPFQFGELPAVVRAQHLATSPGPEAAA